MNQEDARERKIRRVNAQTESFAASEPQGKGKLIKRMGRKITLWYVRPFGQAQNEFNAAAADALSDLHEQVQAQQAALQSLTEQTERRLTALAQEQRQSLARSRNAQQESLAALEQTMNEALCAADPACRPMAGVPPMTALSGLSGEALFQELHAVKHAADASSLDTAMQQLAQRYTALLEESLDVCSQDPVHRPVFVVRRDPAACGRAIREETDSIYRLLKTASRYPVQIVSIVAEAGAISRQGDEYTVPEGQLSAFLRDQGPSLLILCDDTTAIADAEKGCMLMYNSLYRLVGNAPGQTLGGSRMQDLLHLCDYGVHRYCTVSAIAADAMQSLGFRRPAVMTLPEDDRAFVCLVEDCAGHPVPYGVIHVSEWDRQLKAENQHLIKGYAALKAYYQRQESAKAPSPQSLPYPRNCFVLMEQQSITVLLSHLLRGKANCRLLDVSAAQSGIAPLLAPFGECTAAQPDLFYGSIDGQYDVITMFHLLRHYEYSDRQRLWETVKRALVPNGLLLFDVPNLHFEVPRRHQNGWGKYPLYDVFWTKESLRRELADHGLCAEVLLPVGQGLYSVSGVHRSEPVSWTAAVRLAP